MFNYYLISPSERPQSASVARHLWGNDCDFDSDGNDDDAPVGGWTELTVALRPQCEERVDVDPIDDNEPLVLVRMGRSCEESRAVSPATFRRRTQRTGASLTRLIHEPAALGRAGFDVSVAA
ncbi:MULTISPECIES: hypothetical protein [unclassified Sphingomonas]|uniref:hypothetical protein n=1 Tax=Novosphingobium rhizosphaerae TaxID=1551649 RepID=UPI0015CE8B2A